MPPKKRSTRASKKAKEEEMAKEQDKEVGQQEEFSTAAEEKDEPKLKRARARSRRKLEADESAIEENIERVEKKPAPKVASASKRKDSETEAVSGTPVSKKRAKRDSTPQNSDKKQRSGRESSVEEAKQLVTRLLSPVRKISSSSKIPSPVKRSPSVLKAVDHKKIESNINQAFLNKKLTKLNQIIDDLKASKAEQILSDYKASVEIRLKASDDLIASLTAQNHQLNLELEQLRLGQQIESPAKAKVEEEDLFENELILDMMEQIVGLRIHKAGDQDDVIFFDCSQSGKNGILDYRLTISKEDSSELLYTPIDANNDQEELKEYLPDYFFDNLTFPLDTLQQFYHKIYRGLNK